MTTEEEKEKLAEVGAKMLEDFQQQVQYVMSGQSQGLIMMTFGPGGKTLISGDPAQLLLALETAKAQLLSFHMQQIAQLESNRAGAAYSVYGPGGNC